MLIESPLLRLHLRLVGKLIALIVASSFLAACTTPKYPEVPPESDQEKILYDYIIGPGDLLNVYVWGYPDLAEAVPVRPDGKITTKLVEDVAASGATPSALARELESTYGAFVTNPIVTVSIGEFSGSQNQQIKVVSASTEAKTIPYENDMTLLDLIIEIGGLAEFANGNGAILIRKKGVEEQNYSLRIDDLIRKADITANVKIRPGDIVIIPERRF